MSSGLVLGARGVRRRSSCRELSIGGRTWRAVSSPLRCADCMWSLGGWWQVVTEKRQPSADPPLGGLETGMIDLTGLSLHDLDDLGQSSLGLALRRVLDPDGEPTDSVVGFQSGI